MPRKFAFNNQEQSRREFLKTSSAAATLTAASGLILPALGHADNKAAIIALIYDSQEQVVKEPPVQWAIDQLRTALKARGISTDSANGPIADRIAIVTRPKAQFYLPDEYIAVRDEPDAVALIRRKVRGDSYLVVCSYDVRGLAYGVLELADRVRFAQNPLKDLQGIDSII